MFYIHIFQTFVNEDVHDNIHDLVNESSIDVFIGLFHWIFSLVFTNVVWPTDSHAQMLEMLPHLKTFHPTFLSIRMMSDISQCPPYPVTWRYYEAGERVWRHCQDKMIHYNGSNSTTTTSDNNLLLHRPCPFYPHLQMYQKRINIFIGPYWSSYSSS